MDRKRKGEQLVRFARITDGKDVAMLPVHHARQSKVTFIGRSGGMLVKEEHREFGYVAKGRASLQSGVLQAN